MYICLEAVEDRSGSTKRCISFLIYDTKDGKTERVDDKALVSCGGVNIVGLTYVKTAKRYVVTSKFYDVEIVSQTIRRYHIDLYCGVNGGYFLLSEPTLECWYLPEGGSKFTEKKMPSDWSERIFRDRESVIWSRLNSIRKSCDSFINVVTREIIR